MAVRTKKEFVESIRKQKPNVYMLGEKVENLVENRMFQPGINMSGATYELAEHPEYKEKAIIYSPLVNEEVSRWTYIPTTKEDLLIRAELTTLKVRDVVCILRCLEADILAAFWAITYEIDQANKTDYHKRFKEYLKYVQKNDLMLSGAVTDAKGDRSCRPNDQEDKDVYLHVVSKNERGIVVRGAKLNITGAPYTNEMLVLPTRDFVKGEEDFAVAFAIPVDTKGLTFVCRPPGVKKEKGEIEKPVANNFGHVESMVVFDDVEVPWERVFMCGEVDFAGKLVQTFSCQHRWTKCACKRAQVDFLIGAALLMAKANGIEKASHVRDHITEMMMGADVAESSAIAGAVKGYLHPSGVYFPDFLKANVGKYMVCIKTAEDYGYLQDISGGAAATMPTERDYDNPKLRKLIEKYYKGSRNVDVLERLKILAVIQDFTASEFSGWFLGLSINAAGSPAAEKVEVWRQYDKKSAENQVRKIANIDGKSK